ncbi:MAG: hypothetical protein IPK76_04990 [Lewinellaceae bacterium]|nr:hypothetical protein [Lewinellaceae bacterium]
MELILNTPTFLMNTWQDVINYLDSTVQSWSNAGKQTKQIIPEKIQWEIEPFHFGSATGIEANVHQLDRGREAPKF